MIVTDEQILTEIKKIIGEHKVALFMKGLPEAPRCGFSARVVGRLDEAGVEYAAVDVLVDPRIRQVLSSLLELAHDPPVVRRRQPRRRL